MGFDAGALLFKIQAVGASIFKQDMRESKTAIEGVDQASSKAKTSADGLGKSTDDVADKAKKAKQPLDEQAKSTKGAGDASEDASKKQDKQTASAERQREAAKTLAVGLLAMGVALSSVVGLSVAKFTEFDAQMSNTSAATMATAQEQRALADAALEAGADTAYSATEAAAAQEELAKAGQSVADITGGSLAGSLALAAAGQLEVARSAEIMATVLTQFRLPASDASRAADVLAAGAGKAQGSVDDLALALTYVGPLAASMGWSLEETAGTIAYFSTQGIAGEKAGTALRGVLAALQAPSSAAAKVMAEYGIQVYDANGKMLGAAGVAEQLKQRLGGLTDQERLAALGRIFGNEALSAATLLYEGGADAVSKWTSEVSDSGYAAEQAAMRQDNLAGDIEKLGGAFDTALIKTGSGANEVLRDLARTATAFVDIVGEAPAPLQQAALGLGAATAAAALLAGATLGVRVKWSEWRETLGATNGQMARSAALAGGVGIGLTALVAVIGELARVQAEAREKAESYAGTLESGAHGITRATEEMVVANLSAKKQQWWWEQDSAFDNANTLGIGLDVVKNAALGNVDALKQLDAATDLSNKSSYERAEIADRLGIGMTDLETASGQLRSSVEAETGAIGEAIETSQQKAEADKEAATRSQEHEEALTRLSGAATNSKLDIEELRDAILKFGSAELDAREASRNAQEAIDAFSKSVQDNGASLDINTAAGRSNEAAIDAIAEGYIRSAAATFKQTGSQQEATKKIEEGRAALITALDQLGINGQAAEDYADKLGLIPSNIPTAVQLTGAQEVENKLTGLTRERTAYIRAVLDGVQQRDSYNTDRGQPVEKHADGGVVRYYANGAVEHHVAQIARAGSYRVWAEEETMGETYVPHAEAKRSRSEQIMAETASLFGGAYISRDAMQSARAGGGSAPSISVPVSVVGSPGMNEEQLAARVEARVIRAIERKLK